MVAKMYVPQLTDAEIIARVALANKHGWGLRMDSTVLKRRAAAMARERGFKVPKITVTA